MLAQCPKTEMVLRELRSIKAVIPRLLTSSFTQSRLRSRARWILAARETVLDREDPLRQINLADSARNRKIFAEPLRTVWWTKLHVFLEKQLENKRSIDFSASSKCVKQNGRSIVATKRFARTIYLENFILEKLHLIRISSKHRTALEPIMI